MTNIKYRILIGSSLLILIFSGISYLFIWDILNRPVNLSKDLELDSEGRYLLSIEKGSNLKRVNAELNSHKIISSSFVVTSWARLTNKNQIQAGDYWITSLDTPKTLVKKFVQGDIAQHRITFPEGWSFKQWLFALGQIPQFSSIQDMSVTELLAGIGSDIKHPEGWFFPNTYNYTKNDSVYSLLRQAHSRMRGELDRAWLSRDVNLPYKSAYEALIMASIIEKETGKADERTEIAGVFVRRLQQGMRLQTDPTVIYGMGDRYKGNIRRSDLRNFTPYNTYRINGLPPTPIAMPGLASIEAALHPKAGSSLYFVARGDGSHQFSDTISEHNKAVRKFQIEQRAQNYQSVPQ
jgi:UPF0755 protein